MSGFFERLQKFGRLYENNAPGYLRTHPLTTERLADMGNRIQSRPYRQVPIRSNSSWCGPSCAPRKAPRAMP
jgi:predicted Zn-dependent protease